MRNLLNAKWLILINTIPLLLLFFIYWNQYTIVNSLLEPPSIDLWKQFGFTLLFLALINFLYTLFLLFKKRQVSILYGIFALIVYIPFLYAFGNSAEEILPFSIPRWMVSENTILYPGTFLMPTLAYALFIIVVHFTPKRENTTLWKNFLAAAIIPIAWYTFSQLILPLWKPLDSNFDIHTIIIFIIIGTLFFLFFLIRAIYILAIRKIGLWRKYDLIWKIPMAIILPVVGLAVNNGNILNPLGVSSGGVFGNFSSYWFYSIALLNGVLVCLPNLTNKTYRLVLFVGRSITFVFIFYFFIVFLPFLPLSIIAVIAFGVGFLMLIPLLLFVVQLIQISRDIEFLKKYYPQKLIISTLLLGLLCIPVCIHINYLQDKNTLNKTLDYVFNPNYDKEYNIDEVSLSKTLTIVKGHKEGNRGGIFGSQVPYLSSYFSWLVLGNLTLSNSKINTIEAIFFGESQRKFRQDSSRNHAVIISNINSKSRFDQDQNAWVSWVNLEIHNQSTSRFAEYATTLELPNGAWISDYYLYVGNRKEYGILAEKKSAKWVFSQIRNENRDPGILYYLKGNKLAFKVFPFAENEVRKTGFEILHKEPFQFNIDEQTVTLGDSLNQVLTKNVLTKDVAYVSSEEKTKLKKVKRNPYYHFLIDTSKRTEHLNEAFLEQIEKLLKSQTIAVDNSKITFTNTYVNTIPLKDNWKASFKEQNNEGGFYLDRALKKALFDAYKRNDNSYPIFIVVTDSIKKAILSEDYSDFKIAFPESDFFFSLSKNGTLKTHSLMKTSAFEQIDLPNLTFDHTVLEYVDTDGEISFLPNDNKSSLVLRNHFPTISEEDVIEKNWKSGLTMQGKYISQILHPEEHENEWLDLVKYSFKSKFMTPYTSYIVVENDAQKAMLKKKQQQVLSGKKALDAGEDTQRMSEPGLFLLLFLLLSGILLHEKRKQKTMTK